MGDNSPHKPAVLFDVEYFDSILNRPDIDEAERHAALKELWNLIGMFLDVGWGVYPMDKNARGKLTDNPQESAVFGANMLYSDHKLLMDKFVETSNLKEHGDD